MPIGYAGQNTPSNIALFKKKARTFTTDHLRPGAHVICGVLLIRLRNPKILHLNTFPSNPIHMADAIRKFAFTQFDVFTSRPLEGNPLAVVHDGAGLADDQMQAIAREMNLSETTFIFPRDKATESERGIRVRIFTVQEELPFAGHPTLGTAFFLRGNSGASEVKLDLKVGTIPVRFEERPCEPDFGEMTQRDPEFGMIHDRRKIAEVSGIPREDISEDAPIQTVSTGTPFTMVPLCSLEAARRLQKRGVDLVECAESGAIHQRECDHGCRNDRCRPRKCDRLSGWQLLSREVVRGDRGADARGCGGRRARTPQGARAGVA